MRFKKDIQRYKQYSNRGVIILLLTQQGLWALFVYRLFNAVYTSKLPKILKLPLLALGVLNQKWIEILTGITLPYSATIGDGLYIGHHSGIIISSDAVIGNHCNIAQGVTIGVSGRGERRGVPIVGDRVYIGANAVLVGKIKVGSHSVIGANSLVSGNVPEGVTVLGVPAKVVSQNDSKDYIL
ncbi:serine acetyltransferase [Dokdonia sinensis]|uniref:Serine acetyltransferase n=1 Tax=Dokdonia sinensis TaxID=2479847 RepID=A0A3M0FZR9_9FLAO|nr:serine acetyltransferase [Dokdonia sinensis]RMB57407.1 serine acetyltransferase [Dokdonia sinensis]